MVEFAKLTLVKKYGKVKEYMNCASYGEKAKTARNFRKRDFIHVFGYFKGDEKRRKYLQKLCSEAI